MSFWNDLRFGWRQLRKSPGFTLTVLATLGLCIGANTAIYSVVDAVLLRAVPYPEPSRLAVVGTAWQYGGKEGIQDAQTGRQFEGVRSGAPGVDVAATAGVGGANFVGQGRAEYIAQQRVSTKFFGVLGVPPQMGREFTETEDRAGGPAAAVLSYGFWRRALHGDPKVLGSAINVRGEPFTVVGIMPRGFRTQAPVDIWTPLHPSITGEGGGSNYQVFARLKPGVSWDQANAQLAALSQALRGSDVPRAAKFQEVLLPFQRSVAGELRTELLLTWAAVLMVLLIGCVNVAGLLLARSASRRREIATRLAVGGSRGAVVRQLLVESVLLALGGGALGIALGAFALSGLKALGAKDMELWHPLALDSRVLATMLGAALLTSIVFGLVPALEASRVDLRSVLVEGGRGNAGGRRSWIRSALVVFEVALSLVLLVSAGLLVRSLAYLDGLNPGFDTHGVLTAQTSLQDARYQTRDQVSRFFSRGLDRIREIPGVQSAAVALTLPFERPLNNGMRVMDGSDPKRRVVEMVYVTPGYFETMRIPILAGRGFRASDQGDSYQVAVVSASFARKFFPGQNALGRHLEIFKGPSEIAGVVGDVQQHSGAGNFGPLSIQPTVYVPVTQTSDGFLRLVHTWYPPKWVVRASGPTGLLKTAMQRAIAAVDPQLPVANFHTMADLQLQATQSQRYHAVIFSLLAGLALLLAAVGLYGLISQSVTLRTREMGIRMALGASVRSAMVSAMRPGIVFTSCGVAIGIGLALVAARFLRHLLWGVQPLDALTFVSTAALLFIVALAATLLPALRVLRLDPSQTLRDE